MKKKLIRRKARIEELTSRDLHLLRKAYGLSDDQFLCFGDSYYRLNELGLISDENQITLFGRRYIWSLSNEVKAKATQ